MILGIDHIAIIISDEKNIGFYQMLGFTEISREVRSKDTMIFLQGHGLILEIFVAANHPLRVTNPEAFGLRHLALKVDDVNSTLAGLDWEAEPIRVKDGKHYTFLKDPDGLPIELHE